MDHIMLCPEPVTTCECKQAFRYPTNFPNFHWWQPHKKEKIVVLTRDELPIPEEPNRYPYRYTSAGPSKSGRTKKEWDMYRCYLDAKPKIKREEKFDLFDVVQVEGYETTSMTASLVPFRSKKAPSEFRSTKIPPGLLEPLFVPFKGHSRFDQYIIDYLYPSWKNDPLYKRRVIFRMGYLKDNMP